MLKKMMISQNIWIKKLIVTVKMNMRRVEMEYIQEININLSGSISGHGLC